MILLEKYTKINTSFIEDILNNVKTDLENVDGHLLEAISVLNKAFKKYRIYFTMDEDYESPWRYGDVDIQMAYTNEDGSIGIIIGDMFLEKVLDQYNWKNFIITLKGILSHELLHRQQIDKVPSHYLDSLNSQSYLSRPIEIDAHAIQAVEEFRQFYDDKKIQQIISSYDLSKEHANESIAFWEYWSNFGLYSDDKDYLDYSKVWRRFIKMMYNFITI